MKKGHKIAIVLGSTFGVIVLSLLGLTMWRKRSPESFRKVFEEMGRFINTVVKEIWRVIQPVVSKIWDALVKLSVKITEVLSDILASKPMAIVISYLIPAAILWAIFIGFGSTSNDDEKRNPYDSRNDESSNPNENMPQEMIERKGTGKVTLWMRIQRAVGYLPTISPAYHFDPGTY